MAIAEISWLVALLLLLLSFLVRFRMIGGLLPILLFVPCLTAAGGLVVLLSLCSAPPLWPASCLPAVDKSRGSKSVEVQRVWGIYDERLQFVSRLDALLLDESLVVWSGAVESALADAHRFSGGPLPSRGSVLGRESASFRVVRLGGHKVRKARGFLLLGLFGLGLLRLRLLVRLGPVVVLFLLGV